MQIAALHLSTNVMTLLQPSIYSCLSCLSKSKSQHLKHVYLKLWYQRAGKPRGFIKHSLCRDEGKGQGDHRYLVPDQLLLTSLPLLGCGVQSLPCTPPQPRLPQVPAPAWGTQAPTHPQLEPGGSQAMPQSLSSLQNWGEPTQNSLKI